MKINAQITILVSETGATIEVRDKDASVVLVDLKISPEKFAAALGRLANVEVDKCEIFNFEKAGKKLEHKYLEFPLCLEDHMFNDKEVARKEAVKNCPDGWESDNYFSSQNSFFNKDGKKWARTTIRRWV